jgi:lipopolysaccharide/colanic/teichoic acid biosynthesis glycosyltransferase
MTNNSFSDLLIRCLMPLKRSESAASESAILDAPRASNYNCQWGSLIGVLLILDSASVLGSLILAYTLRISSGLLAYSGPQNEQVYRVLVCISVPVWLALFTMMGLYRRDTLLGGVAEYQRVVKACTAGVMAFIVLSFLWRGIEISRGWLSISWGFACVLVGVERFVVRRAAYSLRSRGWFTARVLVVGANDQGIAIARQWSQSPASGMQVVGFLDDFKPMGTPVVNSLKVIGRPTALDELARQIGANEVVVVPNAVAWETFEEIIARANVQNSYTLRLSPGFYELLTTGVTVTTKTFVPLLTINETRLVGVDAVLKSLLDYGLGLAMLIVALPVMGVIALGLKLNRRDKPVLARYQTIGQSGATFKMFKFNTRVDSVIRAIGQSHATVPIPPGVSRPERLLYRRGLDKLPQLFNVLAGQMSLVGPRPRVVDDQTDAQQVRNLQTVKPGMIGPWALPGSCSSGDEIQDELYYVRNWTIWLDLHVLFRAVLNGISAGWLARPATLQKKAARSVGAMTIKGSTRSGVVLSQLSKDRKKLP